MSKSYEPKYEIFEGVSRKSGAKTITAVRHYAGKFYRGVAKCHPDKDTYNKESGIELAKARVDEKIAEQKFKRSVAKRIEAEKSLHNAEDYLRKKIEYNNESEKELVSARDNRLRLERIMSK